MLYLKSHFIVFVFIFWLSSLMKNNDQIFSKRKPSLSILSRFLIAFIYSLPTWAILSFLLDNNLYNSRMQIPKQLNMERCKNPTFWGHVLKFLPCPSTIFKDVDEKVGVFGDFLKTFSAFYGDVKSICRRRLQIKGPKLPPPSPIYLSANGRFFYAFFNEELNTLSNVFSGATDPL